MENLPSSGKALFDYLQKLITESSNPASAELHRLSTLEILEIINAEDATVALRVKAVLPAVASAVEMVAGALKGGGRLIYVGAGTSGRLGVLDAAECPPTFGTSPEQIVGVIAGGPAALVKAVEGAEDDTVAGEKDMEKLSVCARDVVVGLTASKRTPYVMAALQYALSQKAKTILVACNPISQDEYPFDLIINPIVGPEVLAGSTRMKAALAEKMILTMITTTAMVKLGKVYRNLMVDLQATSQKLLERGKKVIMAVTGCDYQTATRCLAAADGQVKLAIVMAKLGCDLATAQKRLVGAGGVVHLAIE